MTRKVEYRRAKIIRASDSDEFRIGGVAVPYNSETEIGGWFREQVAPGAFNDSLDGEDIVLLAGHDGMPYARVGAGTMSLRDGEGGLEFDAVLDLEDPDARAMSRKIERGDLTGVSIGFHVTREEWTPARNDTQLSQRRIMEGELLEISMTPFPAYRDTELQAMRDRALATLEAERRIALARSRNKLVRNF